MFYLLFSKRLWVFLTITYLFSLWKIQKYTKENKNYPSSHYLETKTIIIGLFFLPDFFLTQKSQREHFENINFIYFISPGNHVSLWPSLEWKREVGEVLRHLLHHFLCWSGSHCDAWRLSRNTGIAKGASKDMGLVPHFSGVKCLPEKSCIP